MKRLHKITVEFDFVVAVDEDEDPHVVGDGYVRDAFHDLSVGDMWLTTAPYTSDTGTITGWDQDCIPYGGDGNTRTGEYLKGKL